VTLAPDPAYELKGPGSGTVTLSSDDLGSDLVVSALTVPSPSGAGLAVTVSDTTKNQGAGTAPASTTAFYFSANAALDAPDTFLGSRSLPAIAPGASSIGSTSLTIPAGAAAGSYYILARAEADSAFLETNEANNTRIAPVVVGPDLAVTAFTAPASAAPGGLLSVSDTTKNQGGGTAAASTTRFFLSTNTVLDAADLPLGDRPSPLLAPGASSPQTTSLTLPDLPGGAYYLIARADADAVVAETSETNNTRIAAIAIGPDLVVSALTVPSPTGAGLVVSVSDTTKNQGAGTAPASTTAFYFSTNAALDAADTFLAARSLPALAPGTSSVGSTSLTIPTGAVAGIYYILARAEADSDFLETSETNNTRLAQVVVGPDLIVSLLAAPASATAGATITVSDTTKNQGGGTTAATATRFFLSTNTVFDAADLPLGARAVDSLLPNAVEAASTPLTIPPGTASGSYYVLARADGDDLVAETSETNNVRIDSITISAAP
jgi:subtilase family serine protease